MTTELHVAQDISADIQAPELQRAAQLVYDHAGGKPVAQINGYSAHSSPAGQWLTISFDWHENTTTRKARYSAVFDRETADQQWILSEIGFDGEQVRTGQDQPIHFNGYLERKTLEQVTAYAAGKWTRCTTHAYAIGGVITNRLPPISSRNDGSESGKADFVYEVSIRDLSPRRLPVQRPEPNALTIGSISSSDNTYSLRITDDGSGLLMTTQVHCPGENCDPELLACLRANLDQPIDSTEVEKRLQDARAALPARLRRAQVRKVQTSMPGTSEMFFVVFAETPVSESRKESVSVTCYRPTGTREDWKCHYSIDGISQRVPQQTREVNLLSPTFSESELKHIVTELRRQLAVHPDIAATPGDVEVFSIDSNDGHFACSFLHGREVWNGAFSYDGEVRLESVEVRLRLPEDPGAAES